MELQLHDLGTLGIHENVDWIEYFEKNKANLLSLEFKKKTLTPQEKSLISTSIRAFQLGEGSSGKRLFKAVAQNKIVGEDILKATPYFIQEENRHSNTLKKFMQHEGIEISKRNNLDAIFRFLRGLMGLECQIIVLVTAEMIALSYYTILASATKSSLLKTICKQMLQDELVHIIYQSRILKKLKKNRNRHSNLAINYVRRTLMSITIFVVYNSYTPLFKEVHCSYSKFKSVSAGYLMQSLQISSVQ